ncbi:MAG TPA: Rrf2 family transcriptional regulator [Flavipsychrobacter sp.]|jgi:Rrf2 family protein|nr:Rrf2 family transcriptional regulator [Flavipsychrobacter sp.]
MFSKACEYGIKSVLYIASQSLKKERVKIGDVAENSGTPEAFTAKILGTLTKSNIVTSYKGPNGGFEINIERMKQIKIGEIVFALDGDAVYNGCALGLDTCNEADPCPMHEKFVAIRSRLKQMLETTSIYELATQLKAGNTTLIR